MALFGNRLAKLAQLIASGGTVPESAISTSETDTDLRLAPDGAGGVEWGTGGTGGAGPAHFMPYAFTFGANATNTVTSSSVFAASGGTAAMPVYLSSGMLLESITFRQGQSSGARSFEWRLYEAADTGTVDEVPNANGSVSFTPTVASYETAVVTTGAPVTVPAGSYWLLLRNINAATTNVNGQSQGFAATIMPHFQTKTLGSGLGSTIDLVTGWTKVTASSVLPIVRLNGRAFGVSGAF